MTITEPSAETGASLAELIDRLTARAQNGEVLDPDALAAEFPNHADDLRRLWPAVVVLADLSRSGDADGTSPPGPVELGVLGDYRIIREVGRGGMGVVYEAEQISLGRRVALKVLPFAATMDPRQLQRFHNEARAAASLHHEHIVPVHGVGCERGVHFYAMQFIDGVTLAELLSGRAAGVNPPVDDLDRCVDTARALQTLPERRDRNYFRRIAGWIADAADAVEHAHSTGVVHRDIKPGNLMVDAAGKLWVTDFGLARFGNADLTMSGDLLGTLRYMAPEQALAKHGLVDHRADVYGMGATLYELLTGRPAVSGADKEEVLRSIAFDEPTPLRRVDKSIPAELETITLKCLAKEPGGRYLSAGECAADLRRWLGHQAIKATPPTLLDRASKWASRHRAGIAGTLAFLIMATAALAVGLVALAKKEGEARQATATALRRLNQLETANNLLGSVFANLDPAAEEKGGPNLREQMKAQLMQAATALDGQKGGEELAVASFQDTIGKSLIGLGEFKDAVDVLETAVATRYALLGREHVESFESARNLATALQSAGRIDDAHQLLESFRHTQANQLGADHPATLKTLNLLAANYEESGRLSDAIRLYESIRDASIARLGAGHPETLVLLNNLALAYHAAGRLTDAMPLFEQVRDVQTATLGPDHPDTMITLNNIALVHISSGRLPAAIRLLERLRDTKTVKLGSNHPSTWTTLNALAVAYIDTGRAADAVRILEPLQKTLVAKLGPDHPNSLGTVNNLARAYQETGQRTHAMTLFEQLRDTTAAKLGPDHPSTLAVMKNLADAYHDAGRLPEALRLLEQVRDLQTDRLGADHPETLGTLNNLAVAYHESAMLPDAIRLFEHLRKANSIKLGADHPHTLSLLNNLGSAYADAGQLSDAIRQFEQAAAGAERLGLLDKPAGKLIATCEMAGDFEKAEFWRRKWLVVVRKKSGPESQEYAAELAGLGSNLLRANKFSEAVVALRESLAIREAKQPDAWTTFNVKSLLGAALLGQKKTADAEPLLVEGCEGLFQRESQIPPAARARLAEAMQRLIEHYSAVGNHSDAARWRKELEARRVAKPDNAETRKAPDKPELRP